MTTLRVAREAMATRFEIALHGSRPEGLRAAAEEALREVERIEDQLSLYRAHSEVARVNRSAFHEPVRVSPPVFKLLLRARSLSELTQGAFDVTVAPLVRCWGFMHGQGGLPDPDQLKAAREAVGMRCMELNEADCTVRFRHPASMLDLGAMGKGYAIDAAVQILREAGVTDALVHGGTSTVYGMGVQEDGKPWKVAIDLQPDESAGVARLGGRRVGLVELREEALSVSAVWGKSFQSRERRMGHVLDPRLGEPVAHTQLAALTLSDATATDALSTALLVLGVEGVGILRKGLGAGMGRCLVLDTRQVVHSEGIEVLDASSE